MNTDYLISKLIDGTISPEEKILLDEAIVKNPDLKNEIDGMQEIDKQLAEPFNLNNSDLTVISTTFEKVAATYFTGAAVGVGAAAATGKLTGIVSSLSSGLVATSLGVVAVVSTIGYFVYDNSHKQAIPQSKVEQKVEVVQAPQAKAEPIAPTVQEVPKVKQPESITKAENPQDNKANKDLVNNTIGNKPVKELDANAKVTSSNQEEKDLLGSTKDELNLALSQGNNTKVAYLYKKLALLQKQSSVENASNNLSKALEIAKSTSNKELEAECYGELALIDFNRGSSIAKDRAKLCLELLTNINSNKLNNWKNKLNKIK